MFRLFVELNQCRHIYFAGCHDTGFGSLLTPYRGRSDRITLIKAASFHRDFENFGLPIKELPSVFMSGPLIGTKPAPVAAINTKVPTAPSNAIKPVCKHFQKVWIPLPFWNTSSRLRKISGNLQIWEWMH